MLVSQKLDIRSTNFDDLFLRLDGLRSQGKTCNDFYVLEVIGRLSTFVRTASVGYSL